MRWRRGDIKRWRNLSRNQVLVAVAGVAVTVAFNVLTSMAASQRTASVLVPLVLTAMMMVVVELNKTHRPEGTADVQPTALLTASRVGMVNVLVGDSYGSRLSTCLAWFGMPTFGGIPAPTSRHSPVLGKDSGRAREREMLIRPLRADRPTVIVVHGPPGAGKSALVSQVLREADLMKATVQWYDLPHDRFEAGTLCEDIGPGVRSGSGVGPGNDVLTRLETAMKARDGAPVFIVVDGAQYLLDPDTKAMISPELAEAIGVIAGGRLAVKLILVLREPPVPQAGSEWVKGADYVWVGGLDRQEFESFLGRLDQSGQFGIAELTRAEFDGLHDALQGLPRLAELFHTVLFLSGGTRNAAQLVRRLAENPASESGRLLARELVNSLSVEHQRLVAGLAAYGMPVTVRRLERLLEDDLSPGQVPAMLEELTRCHVVGKLSDRYYMPATEIWDAVMGLPDQDLLSRVVDLMPESHIELVQRPEELDADFANLDLSIRRRQWGTAYERIEKLEDQLKQWNLAGVLLKYRETIAGKLDEDFWEMVNYNALGRIYLQGGDFNRAQRAFNNALPYADKVADTSDADVRWPHGRRKIYINLAALYWQSGETAEAEERYSNVLDMSKEHHDAIDSMAALAGLANCFRRHGDYGEAIHHGKQALSIARQEDSPWSVGIALRLSRWYSESGKPERAAHMLDIARQEVAKYPEDRALQAQWLGERANLLLDVGDVRQARDAARQALASAPEFSGPVTVVRARTTMAMACLRLGDMATASREIRRALPYRREGEFLLTLALQALIAFRDGPYEETPRRLFAQLEREAAQRRERDRRDFASWDFEGLAICGGLVGQAGSFAPRSLGPSPLDQAVTAFRQAREQTILPPGLRAEMQRLLGILREKAPAGEMDPVLAAAGIAAEPELR